MYKIYRCMVFVLVLVSVFSIFSLSAFAIDMPEVPQMEKGTYLYDNFNLFTDEQIEKVTEIGKEFDASNVNLFIVTSDLPSGVVAPYMYADSIKAELSNISSKFIVFVISSTSQYFIVKISNGFSEATEMTSFDIFKIIEEKGKLNNFEKIKEYSKEYQKLLLKTDQQETPSKEENVKNNVFYWAKLILICFFAILFIIAVIATAFERITDAMEKRSK